MSTPTSANRERATKQPPKKGRARKAQLEKIGIFERYNLNETDKNAVSYALRFPDISRQEIQELLGLSREAVRLIFNKPAVQQIIAEFEGNWLEKLEKAKDKATNRLIKHIENPNPAISIRACEDILGIGKTTATDRGAGARTLEDLLLELRNTPQLTDGTQEEPK